MNKKLFKSKNELINFLIKTKNVNPSTIQDSAFNEKTYTSLITPYTCLVADGINSKTGKKIYSFSLDFNLFLECNIIDGNISNCLYIYISAFEKRIRNFVIETVCLKLRNDNDELCVNVRRFDDYINGKPLFDFLCVTDTPSLRRRIIKANQIIDDEQRLKELEKIKYIKNLIISKRKDSFNALIHSVDKSKNKKNSLENHYCEKYGFIPLYIGMHRLTFGELLSIYSVFSIKDKNVFMQGYYHNKSHIFSENDAFKFESRIKRINDIRNIVAHNEPIIPLIINDKKITGLLSIFEKLKNNYNHCVCKSANSICIPKFSVVKKNIFNKRYFEKIENVIDVLNT